MLPDICTDVFAAVADVFPGHVLSHEVQLAEDQVKTLA